MRYSDFLTVNNINIYTTSKFLTELRNKTNYLHRMLRDADEFSENISTLLIFSLLLASLAISALNPCRSFSLENDSSCIQFFESIKSRKRTKLSEGSSTAPPNGRIMSVTDSKQDSKHWVENEHARYQKKNCQRTYN